MNLPNQLTVARLFLTLIFVAILSLEIPHKFTIGLTLFVVASITDYLDGKIARKHNLITNFGKLMDPLADKVLVAAAFVMLLSRVDLGSNPDTRISRHRLATRGLISRSRPCRRCIGQMENDYADGHCDLSLALLSDQGNRSAVGSADLPSSLHGSQSVRLRARWLSAALNRGLRLELCMEE